MLAALPAQAADVAALCGAMGLASVIVWPLLRSFKAAIVVQCVGAVAFALHFALIGALTAAAVCLIASSQLLAAGLIHRRRVVLIFYAGSLGVLAIMTAATWHGLPSALASCGSILGTLARFQTAPFRMKAAYLLAAPFSVAHNLLTGAIFGLAVDLVSITTNTLSLVRAGDCPWRFGAAGFCKVCMADTPKLLRPSVLGRSWLARRASRPSFGRRCVERDTAPPTG